MDKLSIISAFLDKIRLLKFLVIFSITFSIGYILYSPQITFAATKRIEVNLTKQQLYAFENGKIIYNFPISSGTLKHPTMTGTFYPWGKYLSYEMIGGSKTAGDFYDLRNVPYVVYFNGGAALHGTYWHSNFGHPMSHGCINLPTADAKIIYNWIDFSTPINIYGVTPRS